MTDLERRHISELHELAAAVGVPRFRTLRRDELAQAIVAAGGAPAESLEQSDEAPPAHVYAIVRVDHRNESSIPVAELPTNITVEKIVASEQEARREIERLNALVASRQFARLYFWQVTRQISERDPSYPYP